ncbi:MAG: response regulator transcription factor [Solobacterium sp.]|nr:response regulator transcription factor [Solobacterium sp.]
MIYCVEDDQSIRDLMVYTLNVAGFEAAGFPDGKAFWEAMTEHPQLIMLDIMLPGEDGLTILKKLKKDPVTTDIPVIMATAKGSEYDTVAGLDLGADDYLCKPFGMMEMVSRIKAVLRRSVHEDKALLVYKDLEMDMSRHTVKVKGKEITFTLKEYDILKLFMENIGIVLTRERLLEAVWDQSFIGESRTVDVHIGTLRSKLGSSGDMIQTVRGVGYRME